MPQTVEQVKIQKTKTVSRHTVDAAADIELINQHAIKELKPEEVFVFSVVLCDNDVDRDFEAFADSTLDGLAPLFVGKTGIFNHSWDAKDQVARIYKTEVETAGGNNSLGKPLKQLLAYAYILRTRETSDVINKIEGGILKEVSVGVIVKGGICSICGSRMRWAGCEDGHDKGMSYEEGLCYGILTDPVDAYEFSFVAVPAQRGAGVTKSMSDDLAAKVLSTELTPDQATAIMSHCQKILMSEDERRERREIVERNKQYLVKLEEK